MDEKKSKWEYFLIIFSILIFIISLIRSAWVCDDAFITFRTVDNLVNGYGLTWNPSERVQTFTNPLWMFLVSLFYFFTREIYFTNIFLCVTITLFSVCLLSFRITSLTKSALLGIALLLFSKAFIEYSTSGMENSLSHLLLLLFLFIYLNYEKNRRTLFFLSLVAAFGMLNRMDTILLYLPCLLFVFFQMKKIKKVQALLMGFIPFMLWEAFSLFYYGSLFPNTAYAKLNTGIEYHKLLLQGCYYLLYSIKTDRLTMTVIVSAVVASLFKKEKIFIPVAAGVVLYVLYVVKIGGDFMSGRFLTAPLVCSAVILVRCEYLFANKFRYMTALVLVFLLGLTSANSPLLSYEPYVKNPYKMTSWHGIMDERAYLHHLTGLMMAEKGGQMPKGILANEGRWNKESGKTFGIHGAIGMWGYFSGPGVYVLDFQALCNPLLAKLPVVDTDNWRIGHFERNIPFGYLKTLKTGKNFIENKDLATYYERLSLLTRGELINLSRLREILNFALGKNELLVKRYTRQLRLENVHGVYFDSNTEAFSYIKRSLEYDALQQMDSSLALHLQIHKLNIKLREEEIYYWSRAMVPFFKKHRSKIKTGLDTERVFFMIRYCTLKREENLLISLYQEIMESPIPYKVCVTLAEIINLFQHEDLILEAVDNSTSKSDRAHLSAAVTTNLAIYYDLIGKNDRASSIYQEMQKKGIIISDHQKEVWLRVMTHRIIDNKLIEEPRMDSDYLIFFLRYFWVKQDNENLNNLSNFILKGQLTASDWFRLLEFAKVLRQPRIFQTLHRKALSQYPDNPQLWELIDTKN